MRHRGQRAAAAAAASAGPRMRAGSLTWAARVSTATAEDSRHPERSGAERRGSDTGLRAAASPVGAAEAREQRATLDLTSPPPPSARSAAVEQPLGEREGARMRAPRDGTGRDRRRGRGGVRTGSEGVRCPLRPPRPSLTAWGAWGRRGAVRHSPPRHPLRAQLPQRSLSRKPVRDTQPAAAAGSGGTPPSWHGWAPGGGRRAASGGAGLAEVRSKMMAGLPREVPLVPSGVRRP